MKKRFYEKNIAPAFLDDSYSTTVEVEGDSLMIVNKFDVQSPAALIAASGIDEVVAQFFGQVAGMTTDVTIDADVAGAAGNVTLVQDGSTIAALVSAWNLANPTNSLTVSAGDDTQIPTANIVLSGGIDSIASDIDLDDFSFSKVAHGMVTGTKVQISTSGTLPGGLVAVTDYYIIKLGSNKVSLASSYSNALLEIAIEFSDVGLGNQTITPVALAGASWLLQYSADGQTWIDVGTATAISADSTTVYEKLNPVYRMIRIKYTLTAGQVAAESFVLVKGEERR